MLYHTRATAVAWLTWILTALVDSQPQIHRKFQYKHSFRGPNLAQRDGTIPFWDVMGDAMASSEQLRLVPSMRSKKGAGWSKKPMTESDWWEAEITLKVTGQGRIGADGLGFWFTAAHGQLGPVFGSNDYWTGLGIFFDSFDNDAQRNNPYIMMMINDGTRSYDHQSDGSNQMLAGCQKDYRNRPFPVKVKVEYLRNVVQVLVHDGMTQHDRFELCMRSENIFLPKNGFFGLSAATGGLADDHDILAFNVFSLLTEAPKPPATLPAEEQTKYQQEFEQQYKEFEKEKQKFREQHPDKVRKPLDEEFEDVAQRELRLIYETQNVIHNTIQQLEGKLNQIIQQQGTHTQMLSQRGGGAVQQQQGGGGGAGVETFQRHEVNEIMQLSREMTGAIREMKTHVADVYSRTLNIEQRVNSGVGSVQAAGGGGGGGETYQFQSIKTYLEQIKTDVEQVRVNQRNTGGGVPVPVGGCPEVDGSCLNKTIFFIVIAAQSIVLIMFFLLKVEGAVETSTLKSSYDWLKSMETTQLPSGSSLVGKSGKGSEPLAQLILDGLDAEQIWQQLRLQNDSRFKLFRKTLKKYDEAAQPSLLRLLNVQGEDPEENSTSPKNLNLSKSPNKETTEIWIDDEEEEASTSDILETEQNSKGMIHI